MNRKLVSAFLLLAAGLTGSATQAQAAGDTLFAQKCAACHANTKGAPTRVGPTLFGIYGRKAASMPGFTYSPAMTKSSITWNAETLGKFLEKPGGLVPGTRMPFSGLATAEDRAALIKYLKDLK